MEMNTRSKWLATYSCSAASIKLELASLMARRPRSYNLEAVFGASGVKQIAIPAACAME